MYGKAYEAMYQGSLVGSGLHVWGVWNYVVVNTHFGVIDLNPVLLAAILGCEVEQVEKAIEYLCRPDPKSRSKAEGGRRLVREGQFQYRVVNWLKYQDMKSGDQLREYNRLRQAEYRARVKMRAQSGNPDAVALPEGTCLKQEVARRTEADPITRADRAEMGKAKGSEYDLNEPEPAKPERPTGPIRSAITGKEL